MFRTVSRMARAACRRARPDALMPGNLYFNARTPGNPLDVDTDESGTITEIDRLVWAEHRTRHPEHHAARAAARGVAPA